MPELRLSDKVREFLLECQGKEIDLHYLRSELKINPDSTAWHNLRKTMSNLVKEKIVKPSGRKDGIYKVIKQVQPVRVFGRERREPIDLNFPKDFSTEMEMCIAGDILIREGDMVLISGRSNYGKTTLCMNFCGENIDLGPVLMGNEYTSIDGEPTPRFLNRLDSMEWVEWYNGTGEDKFVLLPVRDDYAEHIVKDRINIIDWINIESGEHYLISKVMQDIKLALGKGIAIIAIQKAEGAASGRGGQFTKDFADVEILLDEYSWSEVLMTMGKVKESRQRVTGRNFAFGIQDGVKITNFRELKKCGCNKGWVGTKKCFTCDGTGFVDA